MKSTPSDTFVERHIGPNDAEVAEMLRTLGVASLDALTDAAIPAGIRLSKPLKLAEGLAERGEHGVSQLLAEMAAKNQVTRCCLGMGYYDCITPPVIQRNVLENPAWYTAYTPYQAEIAQGRLEALLNFQTMVSDLTGLAAANASLLDEATAAAEAMHMAYGIAGDAKHPRFFIADDCHPQTIAVVRTRAASIGIDCSVGKIDQIRFDEFGLLVQYPATDGRLVDYSDLFARAHAAGVVCIAATDLLALTLLKPPGEMGADIAVGSSQRFGIPMGFGGPHAAFLATSTQHLRRIPGRIVGVSRDAHGHVAYRLAIQTREQHIRRERATSNICTAQVLPAVIAGFYAAWHGPEGLKRIAQRVTALAGALAAGASRIGHQPVCSPVFDTVRIRLNGLPADAVLAAASSRGYTLRDFGDGTIGAALDETTSRADVETILESMSGGATFRFSVDQLAEQAAPIPDQLRRITPFLTHSAFNQHHSETEMLRYIHWLAGRDLSLTQSMIPLGSCTMKLNATSEMAPVTWPPVRAPPSVRPADQWKGYAQLIRGPRAMARRNHRPQRRLPAAQRRQPGRIRRARSPSRAYHQSRGQQGRNVCLIPTSRSRHQSRQRRHGRVYRRHRRLRVQRRRGRGRFKSQGPGARATLGRLMITYPSTHGVFDDTSRKSAGSFTTTAGRSTWTAPT
jgi:glycine dehydrogenase